MDEPWDAPTSASFTSLTSDSKPPILQSCFLLKKSYRNRASPADCKPDCFHLLHMFSIYASVGSCISQSSRNWVLGVRLWELRGEGVNLLDTPQCPDSRHYLLFKFWEGFLWVWDSTVINGFRFPSILKPIYFIFQRQTWISKNLGCQCIQSQERWSSFLLFFRILWFPLNFISKYWIAWVSFVFSLSLPWMFICTARLVGVTRWVSSRGLERF